MDVDSIVATMTGLGDSPLVIAGLLFLLTFASEDAATVGAALLVSQGVLALALGFAAVNLGIILGDAGLYGLGALAARYRPLRALVATPRVYRAKRWIRRRLGVILFGTRFIPGSRLPTYTACGFFGFPFGFFLLVLIVAALIWTGMVFAVIATVGRAVLDALGPWKWFGGLAILAVGIILPHIIGPSVARKLGIAGGPKPDGKESGGS